MQAKPFSFIYIHSVSIQFHVSLLTFIIIHMQPFQSNFIRIPPILSALIQRCPPLLICENLPFNPISWSYTNSSILIPFHSKPTITKIFQRKYMIRQKMAFKLGSSLTSIFSVFIFRMAILRITLFSRMTESKIWHLKNPEDDA